MAKAVFKVIIGDKRLNKFMRCADMFEESKALGELTTMEVSFKEGEVVSIERAGETLEILKKAIEDEGSRIVTLIHLQHIVEGSTIIPNNGRVKPYVNKTVRVVSDGKKWGMLHELLKGLGLKVTTDEHMFVKDVI